MAKSLKESQIQKQILQWLKGAGYFARKVPLAGMMVRSRGKMFMAPNPMRYFPDIIVISKHGTGKFFLIEVKTKTGRLSEGQAKLHEELRALNVEVTVVRSLSEAKSFITEKDLP